MPFESDRSTDQRRDRQDGLRETRRRRYKSEISEGARKARGERERENERRRARETGGARSILTTNPVVTHRLPYS